MNLRLLKAAADPRGAWPHPWPVTNSHKNGGLCYVSWPPLSEISGSPTVKGKEITTEKVTSQTSERAICVILFKAKVQREISREVVYSCNESWNFEMG